MNTAPGTNRYTRGKSRGAGGGGVGYRPYFYFRRNGRIIPANSRGNGRRGAGQRGAGGHGNPNNAILPVNIQGQGQGQDQLMSSFLRTQIYAAPEDCEQLVKCVAVELPEKHPGWHLYFYKDAYDENSILAKRVQFMTEHYKNFIAKYNFLDISKRGYFVVLQKILQQDEELNKKWPTLMSDLQTKPARTMATMAIAMQTLVFFDSTEHSESQEQCTKDRYVPRIVKPRKIYARPVGFMSEQPLENLSNMRIDELYCVRVVVKSVGPAEAYGSWICYKCSRCQQEQMLRQNEYRPSIPYTCKKAGCLAKHGFMEKRSSPFTRLLIKQTIHVSEARLDFLNCGEEYTDSLLEVELRYDMVDSVIIGQEIVIIGILKLHTLTELAESGQMQIYLKACSIVDSKYVPYTFSEPDMQAITMINSEPDSFKLLVHSVAPEVHGQELSKAGVLLSLLGGAGSQIHEEEAINVLLVGDPGVGKSHIVQMCAQMSPKGSLVKRAFSCTSQKLTVQLKGRSHFILNSGGLVRASKGQCCLDDIDRLASQQDALMNVLQSQLITVATPSIFSTFNCPTSIIATANPMRAHYDQSKSLTDNIRVSPFLLNEFHLVFVMLDKPNKENDRTLGQHVRAVHAGIRKNDVISEKFSRKPKLNNSVCGSVCENETGNENIDLCERLKLTSLPAELDLIPTLAVKKFIVYARQQVKPLFINESAEVLRAFYMDIRRDQQNGEHSLGLSSGHFAGLIRLCQARARLDFSNEITKAHVNDIISLVKQSNSDICIGDYIDNNPGEGLASGSSKGGRGNLRKFIQMLKMRSSVLVRRIFEYDELKDMARRVGISSGVNDLIDKVNLEGILLKKGPNMYELVAD